MQIYPTLKNKNKGFKKNSNLKVRLVFSIVRQSGTNFYSYVSLNFISVPEQAYRSHYGILI